MRHIPDTDGDWQQCAGYRKKVLLTEIDLNAPGTLVQIVEIAPRTAVAAHFHDHCTEVFHVTGGRGRFVIGGNTVDLEPGDTLTCEPNEVHETRNDGDVPFTYVVFKTNAVAGDMNWLDNDAAAEGRQTQGS